jgi:hypothetical protein
MSEQTLHNRSLEGMTVGITISASTDSADRGYSSEIVNRLTIQLAQKLLAQGARLVLGHKWQPSGIMMSVYRWAMEYQTGDCPAIVNFLAWPDAPELSAAERREAGRVIDIRQVGLPDVLQSRQYDREAADYPWLRARALTHMRRQIVEAVDAQVCLGGRAKGSTGRFPGVLEEIYMLTIAEKPVYLSSLIGGMARQIIATIRDPRQFPEEVLETRREVVEGYGRHPASADGGDDAKFDPGTIRHHFTSTLHEQSIREANRLSAEDHIQLWDAETDETVFAMVLRGLRKLAGGGSA